MVLRGLLAWDGMCAFERVYRDKFCLPSPRSTWNKLRCKFDADVLLGVADAMVNSGMIQAGYKTLNIDDVSTVPVMFICDLCGQVLIAR
jgi:hypothetical protein